MDLKPTEQSPTGCKIAHKGRILWKASRKRRKSRGESNSTAVQEEPTRKSDVVESLSQFPNGRLERERQEETPLH